MTSGPDRQGTARASRRPSDPRQERRLEAEDQQGAGGQGGVRGLSPGKRQVMERFFTPVHVPAQDEVGVRRRHRQHQDRETHSYTMLDDDDGSAVDRHRHHHHHHSHHLHDDHMHHHHHHHPTERLHHGEDETSDHHTSVTLSRASSSSLSSSSSSSSSPSTSSWSSEASGDAPFSLMHVARPQHSLSCSNILDTRGKFSEDDASEPAARAAAEHRPDPGAVRRWARSAERDRDPDYAPLNRSHSRSEEGLPLQSQRTEQGRGPRRPPELEHGHLYKTASLGRGMASCGDDDGPKRAVSSCLLPTRGVPRPGEAPPDIRKARSMEVLSPRVQGGGRGRGRGKEGDRRAQQAGAAEKNFVRGKLQFSAFLDEITRQVISPSRLNTLGVNVPRSPGQSPASVTPPPSAAKTQLLPKKHKRVSLDEAAGKASGDARSRKVSQVSETRLRLNVVDHVRPGSPPPPAQGSDQPYHASGRKGRPSPTEGPVGDRQGRYGPLLADGPEPKQRHHKYRSHWPGHGPPPQPRHPSWTPSPPPPGRGTASDSPSGDSSASGNSRNRDVASAAAGPGSEQGDSHRRTAHRGRNRQHRASLCDTDHFQALQEENADLHQNLLQTVVCIESLEAELLRTREELSHFKENYKRLQDKHSSTQHTSNLLGEEMHTAAESITSERKYLIQRVSELIEELENAHKTIASLEDINVSTAPSTG